MAKGYLRWLDDVDAIDIIEITLPGYLCSTTCHACVSVYSTQDLIVLSLVA